jgi:hypothetical protein
VGDALTLPPVPEGGQAELRDLTAEVMEAITGLVVDLRDRYPRRWTK